MEHESAQLLRLKRFLQYGSEVDGSEADLMAASQPSNSAAQLSSQSLDFMSAGELAFVQQHQDTRHAGGSALSPSLSLSLAAGLPSQQQHQTQHASLLRSRSESQARVAGRNSNAASARPHDNLHNQHQLQSHQHIPTPPVPEQRTIYTGRVQAAPISVLCEATDCGALLEVNVPLSRRTGTVCIRCGNCSKLLEVDFGEEARPAPSTAPGGDALKSMSGLVVPKTKAGKKLGPVEGNGHKALLKKSREPKVPTSQRPKTTPGPASTKSPGVRKRDLPVRGPSKYNLFIKTEIPRLKEANPNMTHKAAFSIAAKNWKSCPWNPHGTLENSMIGDEIHTNGREVSSADTSLLKHGAPLDELDQATEVAAEVLSQDRNDSAVELPDSQGLPDMEGLDEMDDREDHCPTPLSHADMKAACDLAAGVDIHSLND